MGYAEQAAVIPNLISERDDLKAKLSRAEAAVRRLREALEAMKKHFEHPYPGSHSWVNYLGDMIDEALAAGEKGRTKE